jgi:hypothetical protein
LSTKNDAGTQRPLAGGLALNGVLPGFVGDKDGSLYWYTDKKENQIFLTYKEILSGAGQSHI